MIQPTLHLQVALTGVRRRRGIEGLPADDAQLKVDLVNELLVPPDALMHVLYRYACLRVVHLDLSTEWPGSVDRQ